jgi:hypothetical protein
MEACRGPHIVWNIVSQIAVRLSVLHAGRSLPPEIFRYSFLLQAEQTLGPWCGRKDDVHWGRGGEINSLIGSRTRYILACSLALQPSMLQLIIN